jgi:hypothetical protein
MVVLKFNSCLISQINAFFIHLLIIAKYRFIRPLIKAFFIFKFLTVVSIYILKPSYSIYITLILIIYSIPSLELQMMTLDHYFHSA